jgi:uncharacterized membrane protein
MTDLLPTIVYVLPLHVVLGFLSLITGLLVFLLKKGTSNHIQIGKVYFIAMLGVFLTSIWVSVLKGNLFLLLIGFFSFYLVHSGIRVNRFRKSGDVKLIDKIFTLFYGLCFLSMIGLALYGFFYGNRAMGIVLSVFGGIGLLLIKNEVRYYYLHFFPSNSDFIKEHIGRLTGSYIAAFTAFAVNNVHFLPPVVIWLLPTVIGIFFIRKFSKPYQR